MAQQSGMLIWGTLKMGDDTITLPVANHKDVSGGYHIIDTIANRNLIPLWIREAGMVVRVWNDPTPTNNKEYELVPGTVDNNLANNANWISILGPSPAANKLYVVMSSANNSTVINWSAVAAIFGNAPGNVTAYQVQGDGSYQVIQVVWKIDAYPATTLTVFTNNETGYLIIM